MRKGFRKEVGRLGGWSQTADASKGRILLIDMAGAGERGSVMRARGRAAG
jgi:hypothetical protein